MNQLQKPDADLGVGTRVELDTDLVTLHADPAKEAAFAALRGLPTYHVEYVSRQSDTRRLLMLARRLAHDGIDIDVLEDSKRYVVDALCRELDKLQVEDTFLGKVDASHKVEVREVEVDCGDWHEVPGSVVTTVEASPENVEELFERCGGNAGRRSAHGILAEAVHQR